MRKIVSLAGSGSSKEKILSWLFQTQGSFRTYHHDHVANTADAFYFFMVTVIFVKTVQVRVVNLLHSYESENNFQTKAGNLILWLSFKLVYKTDMSGEPAMYNAKCNFFAYHSL